MNRFAVRVAEVVGLIACATALTWATRLIADETMFIFFVAAVALATRSGGWANGIGAAALSVAAADFFFSQPFGSFRLATLALTARLLSFALVAGLIIVLTDALRRAQRRAEDLAVEADRARHAAEDARAHAERTSAARGNFLAALSHEVRTPVNALLGYADLLEAGVGGPLTHDQSEYVGRLRTAGRHLLSVVNDVLDIAKVDAGRLTVTMAAALAADSVRAATALIAPQATKKEIHVSLQQSDTDFTYCGDPDRVRQIIVNVLSNAIKFTPAHGLVAVTWGSGTAPAAASGDGRAGVWISVRDTGTGVAPGDRDRIFEPFEQARRGAVKDVPGTGLGLAISRRLARRMGGDLQLESSSADGSTFTLWLPIADFGTERTHPAKCDK